ncbi:hypothetical protein HN51_001394 [Arachis hypogaea]
MVKLVNTLLLGSSARASRFESEWRHGIFYSKRKILVIGTPYFYDIFNAFRGEPAGSGFEWHFTPNHNSSADSSTSVGSDLHLVSPKLPRLRGGGLPCGGCQRFESTYLQLVNLADTKLCYMIAPLLV